MVTFLVIAIPGYPQLHPKSDACFKHPKTIPCLKKTYVV
jgi:hypothetical protein